MNIRTVSVLALSTAAQLAFGASPESPDTPTELHPVTVEAPKPAPVIRFDIRAACPGIDAELQKTLSSAWGRVQKSGTFPVQLRVEGNRVTFVNSSVASMAYRPYLRTAFGELDCAATAAEVEDFKFLLAIREPEEGSMSPRVALMRGR